VLFLSKLADSGGSIGIRHDWAYAMHHQAGTVIFFRVFGEVRGTRHNAVIFFLFFFLCALAPPYPGANQFQIPHERVSHHGGCKHKTVSRHTVIERARLAAELRLKPVKQSLAAPPGLAAVFTINGGTR